MNQTEETNVALMGRFYDEIVKQGNLDLIDELMTDDFVEHEAFPGLEQNRDGVRQFFQLMQKAFPDLEFRVDFMIAQGDKVAAYVTMVGTHKGEFMEIPATGRQISVKTVDIVRFRGGKAAEHWGVSDSMAMMQQLGVIPE